MLRASSSPALPIHTATPMTVATMLSTKPSNSMSCSHWFSHPHMETRKGQHWSVKDDYRYQPASKDDAEY